MHLLSTSALLTVLISTVDATLAITRNNGGFNTTTGARPDRLEINGFAQRGGPQWHLFILCMADVQARPQSQIDSWYQIAGIHGRPFIAWDGVQAAPQPHYGGYCPHSSVLFPTWHRPYILLMEQTIWQCAQRLAQTYPSNVRQSYVDAATTLRFPYWDWAAVATLPPVVTQPTITVTRPSGPATIPNPLYQYSFNPQPSQQDFPGNSAPQRYRRTVRHPDANGNSNHNAANDALRQNAGYLRDTTYNILTRTTNYAEFSNDGFPGTVTGAGSIENPHGAVHVLVGGNGGHMTAVDYSAFDPIFWLHHTNVDRMFAIWQALHPNSWNINQRNDIGTFAVTAGTVETANTPLYPFHRDTVGTPWTSNPTRGTRESGYTYPEIRPWGKSAEQNAAEVRAAIRRLYDPNGQVRRRDKYSKRAELEARQTSPLNPVAAIVNGQYRQWEINIEVDKFALPSSFVIYFFMGTPGADSSRWAYDPSLVASFPVLRPASYRPPQNVTIYNTIPLTRSLLGAINVGRLGDLEAEMTTSYIQDNLNWRLADLEGRAIDVASVPSLSIFVVDQEVTPPRGATDLPQYGTVTPHLNATEGMTGAAESGDGTLTTFGFSEDGGPAN